MTAGAGTAGWGYKDRQGTIENQARAAHRRTHEPAAGTTAHCGTTIKG
jgi:hypothetical protein